MTERPKWWKAFLPKKKTGASKDTSTTSHALDPDFDPFAQRPEKQKDPAASKTSVESSRNTSLLSDDTYDDSQLESVFNEQTCRRNMNVSRSGRYRQKQRVRSSLPIQEKETDNVPSGKEDKR
ncbi:proline-rich protein 15-like protein [Centropristis striata]|uniref:proline-rich protein 15-like protein n=1 Tax=Centropristis striata TaxID=184440 RepID=UPI0027E01296|nr:proline-rich protein 15-like protein [Centropristis striata]